MKRRAFVLNSVVLVLLIPLLLLIATYEDISSQILTAQAERLQVERTFRGVGYLELDFQKALEIASKRALIVAVNFSAMTGNFIDPEYKANNTIRDLLLYGSTSEIEETYANLMQDQTIYEWLIETDQRLRKLGFRLFPDVSTIMEELEKSTIVAPLDSFRIVIISRIPEIKIEDFSGKIVYNGSLPRTGNITAIISIQDIEDPLFAALSKGEYVRAVKACSYSFPELSGRPIVVLEGNGSSTSRYLVGEYLIEHGELIYGEEGEIIFNSDSIWYYDDSAYITNITMNNVPIKPPTVLNSGDRGVLVFGGLTAWYSSLEHRINVTITNNEEETIGPVLVNLTEDNAPEEFFNYADSDRDEIPVLDIRTEEGEIIEYWVENWDVTWTGSTLRDANVVVWLDLTLPPNNTTTIQVYFGESGTESLGVPSRVFSPTTAGVNFYEGFENDNWVTGWENDRWQRTNETRNDVFGGFWSVESQGDGASLSKEISINSDKGGKVIFWWLVEGGNPNNKYIQFSVGGTLKKGSNIKDWERVETYLLAGSYTLKWEQVGSVTGYVDDVFILQYPDVSTTSSEVEEMPSIVNAPARAYDIQPLLECIMGNRYFGIYNAPSFFERLEGSMVNHEEYVQLAEKVQALLGISYHGTSYPIGLVSLMLPSDSPEYDTKLLEALNAFEVSLSQVGVDEVTSADYYFLQYYFARNTTVKDEKRGYRVWGISMGEYRAGDLTVYPFFLDNETAIALFGGNRTDTIPNSSQVACDLLLGYPCG